ELCAAGFTPIELADPETLRTFIRGELAALEKARAECDRLEGERKSLEATRARLESEAAAASGKAEAGRRRVGELSLRAEAAQGDVERATRALEAAVARGRWQGVAKPPGGRDERDV